MNKLFIWTTVAVFILGSGTVSAATAGKGRVSMQGAILETACSIDVNSREQTIKMGAASVSDIIRNGEGHRKNFSILLVNCVLGRVSPDLPDWKGFRITFDGNNDNNYFGVNGSASGVALEISDYHGHVAKPGEALPTVELLEGDMRLNYSMRLVKMSDLVQAGEYSSAIKFKLDYF